MTRPIFPDRIEENPCHVESAELVVGIPSLNEADSLYDCAVAFRRETVPRETCMESLMPIYFGRVCSGARATAHMDVREVEVYIEEECRVFEETKPWLTKLWH